tara:strand:+ start:230 stop:544 length:315 start_codon:yes stop_codon:yes gene_type:complete
MKKSEIIEELEKLKKSYKKSFDFHQAVVEKNAICLHVLNMEEYPPYGSWGNGQEELVELYQKSVDAQGGGENRIIDLTNLGKANTYWQAFIDIDALLEDIKEGE